MIQIFSSESKKDAHNLFQNWRIANPTGFYLTHKPKSIYSLHHVGCHHIGSPFWDSKSVTSKQKICSSDPTELLTWSKQNETNLIICKHCIDKNFQGKISPSKAAIARMQNWLNLGNEQPLPVSVKTKQTLAIINEAEWRQQEELSEQESLIEGTGTKITVNAFERNPIARKRCIEYYGCICCICGFDFGRVYGGSANGYIHVHHLKPLASIGKAYEVDPIHDLRPVCPNCHAVIHLREPPYSIEEMKNMLMVE